jgi:mRNA-degrading endonuclease RelE of RelBE toxin-antitoxin system
MKADYSQRADKTLQRLPSDVRKALFKQVKFLEQNLRHPSLRAKKYDENQNLWQARVNRDWRFYFLIRDDIYYIVDIIPHPKK